jgi:O-glycosyl hydrolase
VLIVLNAADVPRRFSVAQQGQNFAYTMAEASVATFVWTAKK